MTTDKERSEVAKRLRGLPTEMYEAIAELEKNGLFIDKNINDEADYSQIHDAIFGCFPAEHMHQGDYEELHERLADLIDRPTCTIVCECDAYSSWGERIEGMRLYELSCGHKAVGFEKPMYCPKCGAVITDAKR